MSEFGHTYRYTGMKIVTVSKTFFKLYGPFLWMGFNCLKATAAQAVASKVPKMHKNQKVNFCIASTVCHKNFCQTYMTDVKYCNWLISKNQSKILITAGKVKLKKKEKSLSV